MTTSLPTDGDVRECVACGEPVAPPEYAKKYNVRAVAAQGKCFRCYRQGAPPRPPKPPPRLPAVERPDPVWRQQAKCGNSSDPELFFPVATNVTHPDWKTAKRFCRNCPVKTDCLADALVDALVFGAVHGVRGGRDEKELNALARNLRKSLT